MITVTSPGTPSLMPLERPADAAAQRPDSRPLATTRAVKQSPTLLARSASLPAPVPMTCAGQVVRAHTLANRSDSAPTVKSTTLPAPERLHADTDVVITMPASTPTRAESELPTAIGQENRYLRTAKNIGKATLQVGTTVAACKLVQQGVQQGVSLLLKNNVISATALSATTVAAPLIANVVRMAQDSQQNVATKNSMIASCANALLPLATFAGVSAVSSSALATVAPTLVSATLYSVIREMAGTAFKLADNNSGPESKGAASFAAVAYALNQSGVGLAQESVAAKVNDAIGLMLANTAINTAGEVVDTLVYKEAQALAQHNSALTLNTALQPRELATAGKITELLFRKAPQRLSFIETIVLGSTFINLVLKDTLPPAQAKAAEHALNGALIALSYVPFVFAGEKKAPLPEVELEAVVIDALQSATEHVAEPQSERTADASADLDGISLQEVIVQQASPAPDAPSPRHTVIEMELNDPDNDAQFEETRL